MRFVVPDVEHAVIEAMFAAPIAWARKRLRSKRASPDQAGRPIHIGIIVNEITVQSAVRTDPDEEPEDRTEEDQAREKHFRNDD